MKYAREIATQKPRKGGHLRSGKNKIEGKRWE